MLSTQCEETTALERGEVIARNIMSVLTAQKGYSGVPGLSHRTRVASQEGRQEDQEDQGEGKGQDGKRCSKPGA